MKITFESKAKVIANFEGFEVRTDLAKELGGDGTALNPFQLLLTSLSCCQGLFARQYISKHGIEVSDKHIEVSFEFDANSDLTKVTNYLFVGKNFPAEMETPLINAVKACKVKKHLNPAIAFEYNIVRE
ncbi:MAG: OsmC family protein [Bacteroidales bacterium]|jgi:ribosomal protein S12 methylthiotransferase accessory factor|nr:OsmC family protein [Bacteroidales bacterium]